MLRAIREIQPTWIVGENVRGLTNWNGGLVFDQVQADLENEGYQVTPFLLPACAVNAPHRRDRIWFIAYSDKHRHSSCGKSGSTKRYGGGINGQPEQRSESTEWVNRFPSFSRDATNPDNSGTGIDLRNDGNRQEENQRREGQSQPESGQVSSVTADTESKPSERVRPEQREFGESEQRQFRGNCSEMGNGRDVADTNGIRLWNESDRVGKSGFTGENGQRNYWNDFPTQSPVCGIYDGISEWILRNIKSELYATISQRYTDKDLQEVREAIQSQKVQEQIRGLYKIHGKDVLFQTMQLCSTSSDIKKGFSVWSEKASEAIMRKLSKYGTLANTPQGRELEKQFTGKFANTLPYLSHEIALVAMEAERAASKFRIWHRNESIKAYGNAVVPQVVLQIFKAIEKYNNL